MFLDFVQHLTHVPHCWKIYFKVSTVVSLKTLNYCYCCCFYCCVVDASLTTVCLCPVWAPAL